MRLSPLLLSLATASLTMAGLHHAHAAEWTQLPGPATSGVAVYTDLGSERSRHGRILGYVLPNPRQAWFITDYAAPHRWKIYQIASSKQLIEFDCKRSSMRVLTRLYYDGAMAQGRLLATETPGSEFTLVVPGDVEETMHQSACRPPPQEARAAAQKEPAAAQPGPVAALAPPGPASPATEAAREAAVTTPVAPVSTDLPASTVAPVTPAAK